MESYPSTTDAMPSLTIIIKGYNEMLYDVMDCYMDYCAFKVAISILSLLKSTFRSFNVVQFGSKQNTEYR